MSDRVIRPDQPMKVCPFCGEEEGIFAIKEVYSGDLESLIGRAYWYVECYYGCGAKTEQYWDEDIEKEGLQEYYASGKERAIFMWNMRKGD